MQGIIHSVLYNVLYVLFIPFYEMLHFATDTLAFTSTEINVERRNTYEPTKWLFENNAYNAKNNSELYVLFKPVL